MNTCKMIQIRLSGLQETMAVANPTKGKADTVEMPGTRGGLPEVSIDQIG